MLLKDDEIFLELDDHVELTRILLDKIQAEGINFRESVIFPVTSDSTFVLSGMLISSQADAIRDITWMPGSDKPPITPSTKNFLFLENMVEQDQSSAKNAKKVQGFLAKKFKIEKKLKDLKLYSLCWFSNSRFQEIGSSIKLLPAIFASSLAAIRLAPRAGVNKDDCRSLTFADATSEFAWEPAHVYVEQSELTIQKLKTELW